MTQVLFWLGILAGYALTPVVWPVFLPPRMMLYLSARASQESGWKVDAAGDNGASLGLLQFHEPTRRFLGMSDDDAKNPFWAGFYGVRYVGELLFSDWRYWLYLSIPVTGFYWLSAAWRGFGAADALEGGGVFAPMRLSSDSPYYVEPGALRAYWTCLPVALLVTVGLVYGAIRAPGKVVRK